MIAVLLLAAALAQPPAPAAPPAAPTEAAPPNDLCLTNACSSPVALAKEGAPKTVADALAKGDAATVRTLGGAPADAVMALFNRVALDAADKPPDTRERWETRERSDYAHYIDQSLGPFEYAPLSAAAMPEGAAVPLPSGGLSPAAYVLRRRTASGCVELIVVNQAGGGVPSDRMCER